MSSTDNKLPLIGQPDPNRPEATEEEIVQALGEALDNLRQRRKLHPGKIEFALRGIYAAHRAACAAAINRGRNDH